MVALLVAGLVGGSVAWAAGVQVGTVQVQEPWARATAPQAQAGGMFVTLTNHGAQAERLVAAESPVAVKTELHTHLHENGVMRMRAVAAIDLKPGETVALQPGGLHVMFMGLKQPLKAGEAIPVRLVFANAGAVDLTVPVRAAGAGAPASAGAPGHSGH
jgi:copper(I)-binding protein